MSIELLHGVVSLANNMMVTGDKKVGEYLNLERAMGAHVRFGGHFVQVSSNLSNFSAA